MENVKFKGKNNSFLYRINITNLDDNIDQNQGNSLDENYLSEDIDSFSEIFCIIKEEIKKEDPEFASLYERPYPFGFKGQNSYWEELVLERKEIKNQLLHDIPKAIECLFKQIDILKEDNSICLDSSSFKEGLLILKDLEKII